MKTKTNGGGSFTAKCRGSISINATVMPDIPCKGGSRVRIILMKGDDSPEDVVCEHDWDEAHTKYANLSPQERIMVAIQQIRVGQIQPYPITYCGREYLDVLFIELIKEMRTFDPHPFLFPL